VSTAVTLPPALHAKIADLARRIRLLRAARGLSLLALVLSLVTGAVFLWDYYHELPQPALALTLGLLINATVFLAVGGLVVPQCRRLDPEALAALIEEKYPELSERLTSTVELTSGRADVHGSAELIALLVQDTEARAHPLDFTRAFSARSTRYLAVEAVVALLLLLIPSLLLADRAADFARRLLASWSIFEDRAGEAVSPAYKSTAIVPVELAAGSPIVTITPPSYVNPEVHPVRTVQGIADLSALQYSAVRFDFRFNRPAVTARLEVTAKVHASQSGETPREPAYDVGRPSQAVRKAWEGRPTTSPHVALPIQLGEDGLEGRLDIPALATGDYNLRLVLEAEHYVATVVDLRKLAILPDEPPAFTEVPNMAAGDATAVKAHRASSADQGTRATPDDLLRLKVSVEDKVGVDQAEIEYRVNDGPSRFETLFEAHGAQKGAAEYLFKLAGKVKDSDILYYRLKATDNRRVAQGSFPAVMGSRVPGVDLGPQVIYHPAREKDQDRWFALRIDRQAVPLGDQAILAQRDQMRQQIEAIKQKLRTERADLQKVRDETRNQVLTPEQAVYLRAVRKENRDIRSDLRALARETAAMPAVADKAQDIAETEMNRSDDALGRAQDKKADDVQLAQQLQKSDEELASAMKRLEDLVRLNDRVAQDRLDKGKMELLAGREDELARKTAKLADAAAKADLGDVKAEQARVAEELERLTQQSKLFKETLDAVRADAARKLAEQAKELAQAQRDLNEAEKAAFKQENNAKLAELARQQQELADQAAQFAKEFDKSAKALGTPPLRSDEAQKAADALKEADLAETLQRQDRAARDLERVATDLDKNAARVGRKLQIFQELAQLRLQQYYIAHQADQAIKLAEKQQSDVAKRQKQLGKTLENHSGRQAEIAKRLRKLDVPEQQARHEKALKALDRALHDLARGKAEDIKGSQDQAKEELDKLVVDAARDADEAVLAPKGFPIYEQRDQARTLAQAQKDLQSAVRKLASVGTDKAQSTSAENPVAQQQTRQRDLRQATGGLSKELGTLAQEPPAGQAQQAVQHAAQAAQQAENAMEQAQEHARAGNKGQALQAGQRAAEKLEEAAQAAQQAGGQNDAAATAAAKEAGQAVRQGQQQTAQAQNQLKKGHAQAAQAAMQQAAQAMKQAAQAAQAYVQSNEAGMPAPDSRISGLKGAAPMGLPDASLFGKDVKYAGRAWGELPGALRTRVLQDMRARYGEDYARIIQRYFEQIADTIKQ